MTTAEKSETERTERVYEEVLTGNITNHQDVIEVALAQYRSAPSTYATDSIGTNSEDNLVITQELGTATNADGSTVASYATTGLIVVDKDSNQVSPAALNDYVDYVSNSGGLNEYSVYATHTMYVDICIENPDNMLAPGITIQVNRITTTLTYGTAVGASQLDQTYEVFVGYADSRNKNLTKTRYSPSAGTYTYYPSDSIAYIVPNSIGSYMKSTAAVYAGSKVLVVTCKQPIDDASFSNLQG